MVNYYKIWILIPLCEYDSRGLCLRVGSSFLLGPTPNTSSESHLQKVLACEHPCYTWDLGLGTPCEVMSPNFHALNSWHCTDWPQVTWNLGLGTPCEVVSPIFLALNSWDCMDWPQLTWDLGLEIPCEVGSPNFHALNGWDCMDWPQVTWNLGFETPCEMMSPNFHTLNGWDCPDWPQMTWDLATTDESWRTRSLPHQEACACGETGGL